MQSGAYDDVPDLESMQPVALEVLMAAKSLRN
jgi:hypothetical protein